MTPLISDILEDLTVERKIPQGYALWEFTAQGWMLKKDASKPGAIPSDPPIVPGLFHGQLRATPSVIPTESA